MPLMPIELYDYLIIITNQFCFLIFSLAIIDPPAGTKLLKDSWDFKSYIQSLSAAIDDEIFLYSSWMKEYYIWAGFKGYNLVIRVG